MYDIIAWPFLRYMILSENRDIIHENRDIIHDIIPFLMISYMISEKPDFSSLSCAKII